MEISAIAEKYATDELKSAVHDLSEAVRDYRRNAVDRSTVENIVSDVLLKQRDLGAVRRSFRPSDASVVVDAELDQEQRELRSLHGRDRTNAVLRLPATRAAGATGRRADDVERFQQASDRLLILSAYLKKPANELGFYSDSFVPAMQAALDTGDAGRGADYVPRELSNALIERVNLDLVVASLFPQIDMPTNPYDFPALSVSRQHTAAAAENTTDAGQTAFKKLTAGTRKVTLTAKKLGAEALISKELEEDAIIPMFGFIEQEMTDYLSADFEDGLINGDTSVAHMDSDVVNADDWRKLYVGLRASVQAGAKVDAGDVALSVALLRGNRKRMGKYGARPDRLAHIVSTASYVQLLSDPAVFTLEKYGPDATILTGELGKVDNVPVILSEFVRTDLNGAGVYDGVTTNRSLALTVYRPGFFVGTKRTITLQILRELYAEYDQDAVVITVRKAFTSRYPIATESIVAETYDLSIA
jgi:hypothetical protein